MRSTFRVALGPCTCTGVAADSPDAPACRELLRQLESLRTRAATDLAALPLFARKNRIIDGRSVEFQIIREPLADGEFLVILRALYRTWKRPNWISFGCIGRLYAEGLIVHGDGTAEPAPDEYMWEFR